MLFRALVRGLLVCGSLLPASTAALGEDAAQKSDPAAEKMMRDAHLARSTWDDTFPGFAAQLTVSLDGKLASGKVRVKADGTVEVGLPEGPARDWASEQLESIVMHRFATVRDKYDVSFGDQVTGHPLGRLIRFHGGSTHSIYRIKDDVITEVHRQIGPVRFTISVTEVARNIQDQTLPQHFNVSYWDTASGRLKSNHDFTETWTRLGEHDLPQTRLLVETGDTNGRKVYQLRLSEHRLLEKESK